MQNTNPVFNHRIHFLAQFVLISIKSQKIEEWTLILPHRFTSTLLPIVQIRESTVIYFMGFCWFWVFFIRSPFFSVQKTIYLRIFFFSAGIFSYTTCTERKLQEKKVWFQCVMYDRRDAFAKIVPLGKRHINHKMRTGSEGFVFLCEGGIYGV